MNSMLDASVARDDWLYALRETRRLITDALRASDYLREIDTALAVNGAHNLVFRHLLAPPLSQDQFKLLCPSWPKSTEQNSKAVSKIAAMAAQDKIRSHLDPSYGWAQRNRKPTLQQVETLLSRISPLIAEKRVATARRNRLASVQEQAVVALLLHRKWTQEPSRLIDTRAQVPSKHFMHKTRFATGTTAHQEVDVACGLAGTYVLAMECKVTNDETNSVKRINDVIKKATAWKSHWGNFVRPAALLQGVIAAKDVQRLEDNGIEIFWSHDLSRLEKWLAKHL